MPKPKSRDSADQKDGQTSAAPVAMARGGAGASSADLRHFLASKSFNKGLVTAEATNVIQEEVEKKVSILKPVDEKLSQLVIQPSESKLLMAAIRASDNDAALSIVGKHFKLSPPSPSVMSMESPFPTYKPVPTLATLPQKPQATPNTVMGQPKQVVTPNQPLAPLNQPPQTQITMQQYIAMMKDESPKYDRHAEDSLMRDRILAQYILDAARFVYATGMTSLQCSVWLTILIKAHQKYIYKARLDGCGDPERCLMIFKTEMIEGCYMFGKHQSVFSTTEFRWLVDYIVQSYGQHARLITHVFTLPQDLQIHPLRRSIEMYAPRPTSHTFLPLSQGIPAEKWEEHCHQEEERLRLERQAEEEDREAARLQALAEAKAKAEAKRAAELLQLQREAERGLVAPFPDVTSAPIPKPTMENVFRKPDSTLFRNILREQKAQQQQLQQQNQSGQHGVTQPTGPDGNSIENGSNGTGNGIDLMASGNHCMSFVSGMGGPSNVAGSHARAGAATSGARVSVLDTRTSVQARGHGNQIMNGPTDASKSTAVGQGRVLPAMQQHDTTLTNIPEQTPKVAMTVSEPGSISSGADVSALNEMDDSAIAALLASDGDAGPIAPDIKLSRTELSAIMISNLASIVDGLVQGLASRMESQASEFQTRIERLEAAIRAREEDRLAREREEHAAAAGVSVSDLMSKDRGGKAAARKPAVGGRAGSARRQPN